MKKFKNKIKNNQKIIQKKITKNYEKI